MMVNLSAAVCGAAFILVYPTKMIATATDYSAEGESVITNSAPASVTNRGNALASLPAPLAVAGLELNKRNAVAMGAAIVGVASMYNPYRPGIQEGGKETASGEQYDPNDWTAAIKTNLREKFGGVRYGKSYRHAYALVEGADKQAIIKINDVGPLKPGRVIDFNEQTMRYFDPTLQLGLIHRVKITPLLGDDWPTGPIEGKS